MQSEVSAVSSPKLAKGAEAGGAPFAGLGEETADTSDYILWGCRLIYGSLFCQFNLKHDTQLTVPPPNHVISIRKNV